MVKKLDFYYKIDLNEILFKNNKNRKRSELSIFVKKNYYPLDFKSFVKIFIDNFFDIRKHFRLYINYKNLEFEVLNVDLDKISINGNSKSQYEPLPPDIKNFFVKIIDYFEYSRSKDKKWKYIFLDDEVLEEFCILIKKYNFYTSEFNLYGDFIDAFEKLRYDSNYKKEFQNQSIKKEFE